MSKNQKLLSDVKDDLNKLLIKLKSVPEVIMTDSDYSYPRPMTQEDISDHESDHNYSQKQLPKKEREEFEGVMCADGEYHLSVDDDQQELACIRDIVKRLVNGNALSNESQYYNSNC